jgi:hypothetical protein
MATLLDLKVRIAAELAKDDLEDELSALLATHIERACEFYADRKFWFNAIIASASTTANVATVAIPATVRLVERVTIPAYRRELQKWPLDDMCESTATGVPSRYAYYNDELRFDPIPAGIFPLNIYGIAQVGAPVDDDDENIWTNEAQDLIVGQTKATLCRDVYRDPDGTQLAIAQVQDVLGRTKRETAGRLKAPLRVKDGPWASRSRTDLLR